MVRTRAQTKQVLEEARRKGQLRDEFGLEPEESEDDQQEAEANEQQEAQIELGEVVEEGKNEELESDPQEADLEIITEKESIAHYLIKEQQRLDVEIVERIARIEDGKQTKIDDKYSFFSLSINVVESVKQNN